MRMKHSIARARSRALSRVYFTQDLSCARPPGRSGGPPRILLRSMFRFDPVFGLLRRARGLAERAENAAVARLRPEPFAAARAVVEELAGIRRHALGGLPAAVRARQRPHQRHADRSEE